MTIIAADWIAPLVAIVVAFIAGAFSFLGLVPSKEQKISELRLAWIDALREDLATLIAAVFSAKYLDDIYEYEPEKSELLEHEKPKLFDHDKPKLFDFSKAMSEPHMKAAANFHRILLRLNPDDENVAHKRLIAELKKMKGSFAAGKFDAACGCVPEIQEQGRLVLKGEWERVKRGEPTFRRAKYTALVLLLAAILGAVIFAFQMRHSRPTPTTAVPSPQHDIQRHENGSPASPSQPNSTAQADKSPTPSQMTPEDFAAYSMKLREHALPEVKPRKPQELTSEERMLVDAYDKAVSPYEQVRLALAYANGSGVKQDYGKAIELLQQAADQGNAVAEANLASFYSGGKGVPQDYSKAAELYKKAADQGFPLAEVNLGWFYHEGKGVPQDYSKAAELYKKAADQGLPTGQAYLASAYAEGKGVELDYQKAIELYQKSVAVGSFPNAYNDFAWFLATCPEASHRNGQKAVEYATTACVMTQWKVRNFVGTLAAAYAELGDFDKAIKYQKDATALQGDYPSEAEMKRDLTLYMQHKPFRTKIDR